MVTKFLLSLMVMFFAASIIIAAFGRLLKKVEESKKNVKKTEKKLQKVKRDSSKTKEDRIEVRTKSEIRIPKKGKEITERKV